MLTGKGNHILPPDEETLSRKVVHGGFWVFILRIGEKILGFIRLIVVARLLSPGDFGLLGIAALVASVLNIFITSGFDKALIQKKEKIDRFLNTAWTVQALQGFVMFVIIYIIAPFIGSFFNEPDVVGIVRVFAFTKVIDGFRNIGVINFQKEMQFKKQFFYVFSPEVIALITTLWAAYILRNVWALVVGAVVCSVFIVIFSYILHPYRPRWELDINKIKHLLTFSKWVIGYGILIFLIVQGDDIFVGKLLGAAALGLYQMAYRISNLPATQITHIISQVTFPAYTKLQDDIPRLREAYLRVLQVTTFVSFPLAGLIFVLSPLLTEIFLGRQWTAMVPAMQVLCIFGLIRSLTATMGPLFIGVGRPKIMAQLSLIQLIILAAVIYPLTKRWGILGTAVATLIPNLVTPVIASVKVLDIIQCNVLKFLKLIVVPLFFTIVMALSVGLFLQYYNDAGIGSFVAALFIAAGSYLAIYSLFEKIFNYRTMKMVQKLLEEINHENAG